MLCLLHAQAQAAEKMLSKCLQDYKLALVIARIFTQVGAGSKELVDKSSHSRVLGTYTFYGGQKKTPWIWHRTGCVGCLSNPDSLTPLRDGCLFGDQE